MRLFFHDEFTHSVSHTHAQKQPWCHHSNQIHNGELLSHLTRKEQEDKNS